MVVSAERASFSASSTAPDQLAESPIGRAGLIEMSVEQRVGNAALLLDAGGERREAPLDIADIEDEIGLERDDGVEIGGIAAAGDPRQLRPRGDFGQQKLARFGSERLQPTHEQIGGERVERHRRRRAGGIDAGDMIRRSDGPAGRVGDGCGGSSPRHDECGREAAEKNSTINAHRFNPTHPLTVFPRPSDLLHVTWGADCAGPDL